MDPSPIWGPADAGRGSGGGLGLGGANGSSGDRADVAGASSISEAGAGGIRPTEDPAEAGRAGGRAAPWSCGAAAGICTCIEVETAPAPARSTCASSECCFSSGSGSCSCRLEGAELDCNALMLALEAERVVAGCPALEPDSR